MDKVCAAKCAETTRAVYSAPTTKRKSGPKLITDAGPMKWSPDTDVSKLALSFGARSSRWIASAKPLIDELKPFDIDVITAAGDNMIDH
jgi:hypothetical protein